MKNLLFNRNANVVLALPVPASTPSGTIVPLGSAGLSGITMTTRATTALIAAGTAEHGLADGEASVLLLDVSVVAKLSIAVAATQFDKIYVASDFTYSKDATGTFVGYILETIAAPGTAKVALIGDAKPNVKQVNVALSNLAAGADLAATLVWAAPATGAIITAVGYVPDGASAGVDDANTAVLALTDGAGNSIVSKTYNTANQPPATKTYASLGALSATHKILTANEAVLFALTQGATADLPAGLLQIEYIVP